MKKPIYMLLSSSLLLGLSACGGGSDGKNSSDNNRTTGYFIDSPVKGINYECANISGVTDSKGAFSCEKPPVTFKLGEMQIGILKSFTKDNKMYPQDLLDLKRDNFSDEKLIKLIRLLQSLDDDENISKAITISSDISTYFTSNLDLNKSILEILVIPTQGNLVSEEDAIKHLQNSMGADAHIGTPKDNTNEEIEGSSNEILDDVVKNNFADSNTSNISETDDNETSIIDKELDELDRSSNTNSDTNSSTDDNETADIDKEVDGFIGSLDLD
ncbi:MAG: hypothetical protein KAG56_09735 [Sulfurovaceae bacterium]|nr:hypothetical protein [Sulfurovaceae bacterium]